MTDVHIDAPHAAAQRGITEWHRIVTESDWDRLQGFGVVAGRPVHDGLPG
ncbi:hypothetical protein ABZ656_34135 [Streptomyces sp. NPDC007095]